MSSSARMKRATIFRFARLTSPSVAWSLLRATKEKADEYVRHAKDLQNKALANSAESIAETMAAGGMQHAAGVMPQVKIPTQAAPATTVDASAPGDPTSNASSMTAQEKQDAKQYETKLRAVLSRAFNDWGTSESGKDSTRKRWSTFMKPKNGTPRLPASCGTPERLL